MRIPQVNLKKIKKPLKWAVVTALLTVPDVAFAGVGSDTLRGVGLPLVQVMVVAAFGSLLSYITSAFGQGQVSSMIKLMTVFISISIVIGVIWKALAAITKAFGLEL